MHAVLIDPRPDAAAAAFYPTVNYGLERLNQEVSAWMRALDMPDGGKATPPFLAMGGANSVMWNRSLSREIYPSPHERFTACRALQQALAKVGGAEVVGGSQVGAQLQQGSEGRARSGEGM